VVPIPEGLQSGDEAPLLLAFSAGGQDLGLTRSLVETTYAPRRNGWAGSLSAPLHRTVSCTSMAASDSCPCSSIGSRRGLHRRVVPLMWLASATGEISTFRLAEFNPDRVLSLTTFPGFARSEDDQAALSQLANSRSVSSKVTSWFRP